MPSAAVNRVRTALAGDVAASILAGRQMQPNRRIVILLASSALSPDDLLARYAFQALMHVQPSSAVKKRKGAVAVGQGREEIVRNCFADLDDRDALGALCSRVPELAHVRQASLILCVFPLAERALTKNEASCRQVLEWMGWMLRPGGLVAGITAFSNEPMSSQGPDLASPTIDRPLPVPLALAGAASSKLQEPHVSWSRFVEIARDAGLHLQDSDPCAALLQEALEPPVLTGVEHRQLSAFRRWYLIAERAHPLTTMEL